MAARGDEEERRARAILDRLTRESGVSGVAWADRTARRLRNHVAAADAGEDRVEVWGTRIGRAIALLATVALLLWFIAVLLAR